MLESFPGVKSVKDLKALDAARLFAGVVRRMISDPSMKKALANTQIDVFGHILPKGRHRARRLPFQDETGRNRRRAIECGHSSQRRSRPGK